MHPINYSFILNVLLLVVIGLLAWAFSEPLLVLLFPIASTHALERFNTQPPDQYSLDDDDEPAIGFTANVGK